MLLLFILVGLTCVIEGTDFSSPLDISSGSSSATSWALTLSVQEHRHESNQVSFTTRSYCHNDSCSYPGPTIHIRAGDNFTLTIINNLEANEESSHVMNTMNSPNTTNFHTHGLHIDPNIDNVFIRVEPGDSYVYDFHIPENHASGMMWYHDHLHGSSTLKVMGGLVGGLVVEPSEWENIPNSILQTDSYVLVLTRLKFDQELDPETQTLSQGCGQNWTCDPFVQYPACNATDPPVSPYDSFRVYSYYEISRETGSTMDINAVLVDPNVKDFPLVNGQYQPVLQDLTVSLPVILRIVAALGSGIVRLGFSSASSSHCSITAIAYDGVYLRSTVETNDFRLVEGGRSDIQVVCNSTGIHNLESFNGVVFRLNVTANGTSGGEVVSDDDLAGIVRPSYLSDLSTPDTSVDSPYSVAFWPNGFNDSICGFWMGVGSDCSARGEASVSVPDTICNYSQFSGTLGLDADAYYSRGKLVTYVGAVSEWSLYGEDSDATHPFHIHVNHYQVISYTHYGSGSPDAYKSYFEIGQFRDTVPLFDGKLVIRFVAADFSGEIVTHCHFLRHEDLGMMDTFLIEATPLADNEDEGNKNLVIALAVCGSLVVVAAAILIYFKARSNSSKEHLLGVRSATEVTQQSPHEKNEHHDGI